MLKYLIHISFLIPVILFLPGYYGLNTIKSPDRYYIISNDSDKVFATDNLFKYTANNYVKPYSDIFLFGSNMGYYKGWKDEQIGDILCGNNSVNVFGSGVKTLRPSLPARFLEKYGYDCKVNTFKHYIFIGAKDNTVIVGYPSDKTKDSTVFCTEKNQPCKVFKNLYKPIFIRTAKGFEVNPENYYALYLYKTVSLYKEYVKFWEIWNEPDFDETGKIGYRSKGYSKSWWNVNPEPCDLKNIKAPIFYYNRILRISYQVIKFADSSAYIATGGLGYESFVDAMLRNTDNPVDGSITEEYPLKSGAYFDCLSFHIYPQYEHIVRHYDVKEKNWYYMRNSDLAAKSIFVKKNNLQDILGNYGYDGKLYPEKIFILTEYNISRKKFDNTLGGSEVQKNFTIKSLVEIQKAEIAQAYIYTVGGTDTAKAKKTFDLMGLYTDINLKVPYNCEYTEQGIAFKTTSDILTGTKYDGKKTSELNLPDNISGGAFRKINGKYIFVLWAVSDKDEFEGSEADYTFAFSENNQITLRYWNYSLTKLESVISPENIKLNSTPVFLIER